MKGKLAILGFLVLAIALSGCINEVCGPEENVCNSAGDC